MGVSIIRGAISSGKSDMCLKQISEIHEKNPDSKCIMIVPDHYSYETERKFVDFFGGIGLNNIEVLTLRRMSINFLSAKQQNHLTASGKDRAYAGIQSKPETLGKSQERLERQRYAA